MEEILRLENINKSYSGVKVLYDVNLSLSKGEVLCLAGENGAGKSTLIKILSGAETPDSGKLTIKGHEYQKMQPAEAINLGIVTIYQDVDLVDTLTVADNIFLNNEIMKHGFIVDKDEEIKEAQRLLDSLNMKIKADSLVSDLSPGQKQNLQIAKAMHKKAEILILDEPTASLGEEETEALIRLVEKLRKDGLGIIYISHYLDEIFTLGDTVLVLKDGHHVVTRKISETTEDQLIHDMVGRDTSAMYKRKAYYSRGDNALKVSHLSRGKRVHDITLSVSRGEILGIGGLVGAGRTEFVRLIAGADKAESGTIELDGRDITPSDPKDGIRNGISYISEDRKGEGLFLLRSAKENIGIIKNNMKKIALNLPEEDKDVRGQIEKLSIKVFSPEQEVSTLSGGNQQKVAVSRWLLANGDIFIFDEPSKGVDIGAREEIYQIMENLAEQGKIILMVSSTMTELISMSDRIAVMRDGELVTVVDRKDFSEDYLLKLYIQSNKEEERK